MTKRFPRLTAAFLAIREQLLNFVQRRTLLSLMLAAIVVLIWASLIFNLAENETGEPIWRSIVYITSGMDVDPPQTPIGRIAAAIILVSGVVLVSLLTGYVASEFAHMLASASSVRPKRRTRVCENHALIYGWGEKTKAILRELNEDYRERGAWPDDIVVVSEQPHLERGHERIYQNVWHVRGEATDPDVLRATNLARSGGRGGAKVAAILSEPDVDPDEADRRSLLKVLAIENLYPEVLSLVEVQREENREHFMNANADDVVMANDYTDLMLARTAEYPGLAAYVEELLALAPVAAGSSADPGFAPVSFYSRSAAQLSAAGLPMHEAALQCYRRHGVILAGVLGGEGPELLTDGGNLTRVLAAEDQLIVVARPEQVMAL